MCALHNVSLFYSVSEGEEETIERNEKSWDTVNVQEMQKSAKINSTEPETISVHYISDFV